MKQLVICIDLEQDDVDSTAQSLLAWHGAHRALNWARTLPWHTDGVINWFVRTDVQTHTVLGDARWPLQHLYRPLCQALNDGDTVGAHPHLYRLVNESWENDFVNADFSWACAEVALEAHTAVLGVPSRTWRWGDRAAQPTLQARLANAGVLVDCTAEPGRAPAAEGDGRAGLPSYVGHHTEPRVADGLVNWPVSTCALADVTPAATGSWAQQPDGSFDAITDQWVHGWCYDCTDPTGNTVVDVELLIADSVVAVTAADWYRPDLEAAGYGDGRHGARIGMREEWRGLPARAFTLRAAGASVGLSTPMDDLRTAGGVESMVLPLSLDTEPEQFARVLAAMLASTSSNITLATRSEVFLDPQTAAAVERNVNTLVAHVHAGALSTPQSLLSLAAALLDR